MTAMTTQHMDALDAGQPLQLPDELLGGLIEQYRSGEVELTGSGGFIATLIKAVLERGLQAELADHLGYDKHDRAGHGSGNSRNGSTTKTLASEVGPIEVATPRDRAGTFTPQLVPKGERRLGSGLSDMIISLYAGGMTVRDIQAQRRRGQHVPGSHVTGPSRCGCHHVADVNIDGGHHRCVGGEGPVIGGHGHWLSEGAGPPAAQ